MYMTSFEELESIELQTPTEIAQISEIRVPVVKAMAYIKFAIKESDYTDSVDMTAALTTDATHDLVEADTAQDYLIQAILSLENAIQAAEEEGYTTYSDELRDIKQKLEKRQV